jgi:hypothetical protein
VPRKERATRLDAKLFQRDRVDRVVHLDRAGASRSLIALGARIVARLIGEQLAHARIVVVAAVVEATACAWIAQFVGSV